LTTKTRLKNNLSPLRHFTEHLVGVFGKLPRENDLDHKSLRLSIRWLNSTPGESPATILKKTNKKTAALIGFQARLAHNQVEPWLELNPDFLAHE
jgi:hypothetical protein